VRLDPLSKSTYKNWLKCPWKAHAHKNLGLVDVSGPAALNGQEFHYLLAEALSGRMTLERAIAAASIEEIGWWLENTMRWLPFLPDQPLLLEEHIVIDKKGKRLDSKDKEQGIAHGILDVIVEENEDQILVVDWKSGRWVQDDQFERHNYAGLLAHAAFPDARVIRFQLQFVRFQSTLESIYTFEDERNVHILEPNGKELKLYDQRGPLLAWIAAIRNRIRQTKCEPRPGAHCTNWFGRPCIFNGYECPLSENLPAVMDDFVLTNDPVAALKAIKNQEAVTSKNAGLALQAIQQMQSVLERVEGQVKDWSKEHGDFAMGQSRYGWGKRKKYEVDKAYILRALFESDLTYNEIAKAVNISKSSIDKLPAGFADLKEAIEALGINELDGTPVFGPVAPQEEDEE
jgi:hypothetical protein